MASWTRKPESCTLVIYRMARYGSFHSSIFAYKHATKNRDKYSLTTTSYSVNLTRSQANEILRRHRENEVNGASLNREVC